ncbi:Uncharacterised protein [Ralstonia pickettii]|jgi:hypothetical protein|uniref:DUF4276 family protein n=1 Tax=Ralstonia TaxID=48736 RepID=UPI0001E69E1A|nr:MULTISPECIES: DUF4276 family protein [Ralstonia]EFP66415.1 hypothetical protein HMPREF1004_01842 [Ralstonia pickettii]EGY64888.1 hypothetical protein HMPREF0989_01969 [Ralstonia sp. 5_2_56FAA]KFL24614.1 hypothetical protein DP23_4316 [Ralstonia pickettii]MBU6522122.1 DUF4276 family protein [Ralstonia sp. B265]NPT51956.1 DUF4276 family protein [Ralstonia sp. 3N]
MSRVYLLVEGQTEEAFVNELLVPHYARMGLYLTPIIVSTSPGYRGGVVSFAKIKPQIEKLCKQDNGAHVTTLFDLYALPDDFPGKSSAAYPAGMSGQRKAEFLETELAKSIGQRNFIPNLLVHEFEALLFVQIETFEQWTDDDSVLEPLRAVRRTTLPEDINDSPLTAPSKRILSAWQGYQKTFHGPLIACDIGLDTMRAACPHFDGWLQKLEALRVVAPLS